MQNMFSLSSDLSVDLGDLSLGPFSVLGTFLSTSDRSLGASKTFARSFKKPVVVDQLTIRRGCKVCNTHVDANNRQGRWLGVFDLIFASDGDEPLVNFSLDGTSLGASHQGTVKDKSNVAKFWKPKDVAIKAEGLVVRLADTKSITALSLPTRSVTKALEAPLPSLIKLDEELSADIARDIGKPWDKGSEFSQFVDLVEGCGVGLICSGKAQNALFESQIPEPAQGAFPVPHPRALLLGWVYAVAKGLVNDHNRDYTLAYDNVKRLSFWKEAGYESEVTGKLWGPQFWSPSYCAVSCVEQQRGNLRGGSSPA
jgi:hypothetical protein